MRYCSTQLPSSSPPLPTSPIFKFQMDGEDVNGIANAMSDLECYCSFFLKGALIICTQTMRYRSPGSCFIGAFKLLPSSLSLAFVPPIASVNLAIFRATWFKFEAEIKPLRGGQV